MKKENKIKKTIKKSVKAVKEAVAKPFKSKSQVKREEIQKDTSDENTRGASDTDESAPAKTEEPVAKTVTPVVYENSTVEEILEKGETSYHCKMSDGTTRHVPIGLFV